VIQDALDQCKKAKERKRMSNVSKITNIFLPATIPMPRNGNNFSSSKTNQPTQSKKQIVKVISTGKTSGPIFDRKQMVE